MDWIYLVLDRGQDASKHGKRLTVSVTGRHFLERESNAIFSRLTLHYRFIIYICTHTCW